MQTSRIPENQKPHADRDLVQMYGKANPENREQIEERLEAMDGANLSATIKAFDGTTRGSYFVRIKNNAEYNEIEIRLFDTTGCRIATGYIDKGHTTAAKYEAAQELRGLVRAYLCR